MMPELGRRDDEADRKVVAVTCPLCGYDNPQGATACVGCGNEELGSSGASQDGDPFARHVSLFRALVVASTAAYVLWIGYDLLKPTIHSQVVLDVLGWSGYGAVLSLPPIYFWAAAALYVACAFGLYRFSWPARLIFTLLNAFDMSMVSLGGLGVTTGIDAFFGSCYWLADGAILVMAWTSPLKDRFVRL